MRIHLLSPRLSPSSAAWLAPSRVYRRRHRRRLRRSPPWTITGRQHRRHERLDRGRRDGLVLISVRPQYAQRRLRPGTAAEARASSTARRRRHRFRLRRPVRDGLVRARSIRPRHLYVPVRHASVHDRHRDRRLDDDDDDDSTTTTTTTSTTSTTATATWAPHPTSATGTTTAASTTTSTTTPGRAA